MHAPRATYRLQLHPGFTFADATRAVPYLARLGVSHLYLSPILEAAPGSTHGYDVVDPERVSGALGGEAGFRALVDAAHAAGLGILLDIVPNHMSIAGTANGWWMDVLENGAASPYAHYFDVDWANVDERVLLPVLGERYGRALTSGTLKLCRDGTTIAICAGELKLPIAPRSLGRVIRRAGERAGHAELEFLGEALAALPAPSEVAARQRRHRHKGVLLARIAELGDSIGGALDAELAAANSDPGELDTILEAQNYRLAHWSVAGDQLSYRRFFDISSLVGIRAEEPDVLAAGHRRIFEWLADGTIDGVRVDHVDGLRDPGQYLRRLRETAPTAWIVVEKILAPGEQLPASWPVEGTTGYDFVEHTAPLFVDPDGEAALTEAFTAYTGLAWDPAGESRKARHEVMSDALHSEVARLTELAVRVCASSPACRDYTRAEIGAVLAELLAGYPVYRTYFGTGDDAPADHERLAHAAEAAKAARPELDGYLVRFLESALAFELATPEAAVFAQSAQQVSGPIVAKGDEDTLLYRQVRLLSRCEVGAHLATFAAAPEAVHAQLAAGPPRALLATSTHDTKRGEDTRACIAVLSELPAAWRAAVERWRARADVHWGDVAPDRVFEYTMWQAMVGAWPLALERAQPFAEKATREARLRTTWRRQDPAYEAARTRWLAAVYDDQALLDDVAGFAAELAPHAARNSLAQLLIKLVAPGVPDLYQGAELVDGTLVDPDNRRPVDLDARADRLRALEGAPLPDDLGGRKLWTIARVLGLRQRAPWDDQPYRALAASGPHAHRVFAFARGEDLVAVVPRLGVRAETWPDTTLALAAGTWRDVLSEADYPGGEVAVATLWQSLPIALLSRVRG